jgi:hypothetical protein
VNVGFSWDSTKVANGSVTLIAVAYDAAGISVASAPVSTNVANAPTIVTTDSIPTDVRITSPTAVRSARPRPSPPRRPTKARRWHPTVARYQRRAQGDSDRRQPELQVEYPQDASRQPAAGSHSLTVVARDAAGNSSSTSATVVK